MSIWSSIGGELIPALNGASHDAEYQGAGEPTMQIDVATTGHHDGVRLSLWDDAGIDVSAILPPGAARELRDRLTVALGEESSDG